MPFRITQRKVDDIVQNWYTRVSPLNNYRVKAVQGVFLPVAVVEFPDHGKFKSNQAHQSQRAWVYGAPACDVSPWLLWGTQLTDAVPLDKVGESATEADDLEDDAELLPFAEETKAIDHAVAVAPPDLFAWCTSDPTTADAAAEAWAKAPAGQTSEPAPRARTFLIPLYSVTITTLGVPRTLLIHGATGRCAAVPEVIPPAIAAAESSRASPARLPSLSAKVAAIDDALPERHRHGVAFSHARPAALLGRLQAAAAVSPGALAKVVLAELFILMPMRARMALQAHWRALAAAAAYKLLSLQAGGATRAADADAPQAAAGPAAAAAAGTAASSGFRLSQEVMTLMRKQAFLARYAMLQGMQLLWESPELTAELLQQRRGNPNGLSPSEASAMMQIIERSGLGAAMKENSLLKILGTATSGDALLEIHRSPHSFRLALHFDAAAPAPGTLAAPPALSAPAIDPRTGFEVFPGGKRPGPPAGWHMLSVTPGAASIAQAYAARSPLCRGVTVLVESFPSIAVPTGPPFGGSAPSPTSVGTRLFSGTVSSAASPLPSKKKAAEAAAAAAAAAKKKEGDLK